METEAMWIYGAFSQTGDARHVKWIPSLDFNKSVSYCDTICGCGGKECL